MIFLEETRESALAKIPILQINSQSKVQMDESRCCLLVLKFNHDKRLPYHFMTTTAIPRFKLMRFVRKKNSLTP